MTLNQLRIVLLGKTGNGKSSLSNTLLGRDAFVVASGLNSGTEKCQWGETKIDSKTVQVTDTPGLCDTHRSVDEILREVSKSVAVASPGPHAVFMVLSCDRRFTKEEYDAYLTLKRLFGDSICQHMIVVFTAIDSLGPDTKKQTEELEKQLTKCADQLKSLLRDVGQRYIGVNNKATLAERNSQAKQLFTMVQDLVHLNGGKYFSSSLITQVNQLVQPQIQQRMQANNGILETADRETKLAIVEEKDTTLQHNILEIVKKAVFIVLQVAVTVAAGVITKKCSVM